MAKQIDLVPTEHAPVIFADTPAETVAVIVDFIRRFYLHSKPIRPHDIADYLAGASFEPARDE
jgi:hypothetical protein